MFVSGAVAFHPETGDIVGTTVEEQARQTLENIKDTLSAEGLDLSHVVKSRVYLTEIKRDFAAMDAEYRGFFEEPLPASTTIGVELAVAGLFIEIDVIARHA